MIPPGRISDRVIVYSGCTTRSLKFQMPPLLLISRCSNPTEADIEMVTDTEVRIGK